MNIDQVYNYLDSNNPVARKKDRLRQYLATQVEAYAENPSHGESIAYDIAGLLSTRFAQELEDNDPYTVVLEAAGRLELPERVRRRDENWPDFIGLVERLG